MSVGSHLTEARLLLLEKLTVAIAAAKDVNAALSWVLGEICRTTGWVYGEVWATLPGRQQLACHPAWFSLSSCMEIFRQKSEDVTFAFDQGIAGPSLEYQSRPLDARRHQRHSARTKVLCPPTG